MKKIIRMLLFSAIALYLTSLWNHGFEVKISTWPFISSVIAIAVLYYIIKPISKIVLLPFNLLTFGLVSVLVYSFLFYLIAVQSSVISINSWTFQGVSLYFINIPKTQISSLFNIVLSSLSISYIIRTLEKII